MKSQNYRRGGGDPRAELMNARPDYDYGSYARDKRLAMQFRMTATSKRFLDGVVPGDGAKSSHLNLQAGVSKQQRAQKLLKTGDARSI